MTSESRHQIIESLFFACLDLPASERGAYLEMRCGGDLALRDEILDLLAREETDAVIPRLITPGASRAEAAPLPASIGPYRLLEKLGEGGFGEVYAAEQASPVRRRVALKVLKAGMDSKAVLARFEAERQALALMEHPGIAKVHDAGVTESGRPFFVMELVSGESITDYCDRLALPLRDRLALFVAVCRAVEHAHQKGVIHRDIKPSNILVSVAEGEARPRVIDFGIAKATGAAVEGETLHTRAGEFLGTPEYMSPEQASSGGVDVDTRTDVYSLGVVLYRLLTGSLPFDSEKIRSAGISEMQRILREEEPTRPSEAVRAAQRRPGRTITLARELRGDLDWIVLQAMEKERERRYASAAALADDIERHLRDEPVLAGPPSTVYRARKLVRRHRALAAGLAGVIVALVAGLATTMAQSARARRAEGEAREQAAIATSVNAFLTRMLAGANPEENPGGVQVTLREMVDRAAREFDERPIAQPLVEAQVRRTLATTYMGLWLLDDAEPHLRRAIELRREAAGPESPETIESLIDAADLELRRGNYPAAESLLAGVGAVIDRSPSFPVEIRARYLFLRGSNLSNIARFDEADSLLRADVAIRRGQGDAGAVNLVQGLAELSRLREYRGSYDDAVALAREALGIARGLHAGDHAQVADVASRLALALDKQQKNFAEAESLLRESVGIYERVLGPDHRNTAMTLSNLGDILGSEGRPEEAVTYKRAALERLARVMGEENPVVASAKSNLAMSLQEVGRYDEALALYLAVLDTQRRAYGEINAEVARGLNNLGALYRLMERPRDAVRVFDEALGVFRKLYGEEHPLVAVALNNLGKAYLDMGRAAEAEPYFANAVALAQRVFSDGHPNTGIFRGNRGVALAALGRRDEAEHELLAAHEAIAAGLGADHPRARQFAGDLAALYDEQGREDEAARWRAASVAAAAPTQSTTAPH